MIESFTALCRWFENFCFTIRFGTYISCPPLGLDCKLIVFCCGRAVCACVCVSVCTRVCCVNMGGNQTITTAQRSAGLFCKNTRNFYFHNSHTLVE